MNDETNNGAKELVIRPPKRVVRWAAVALISLAAFLIVKTVNEIKESRYIGRFETPQNVITVSGKGEKNVAPDIVMLSFSVIEEASTVKAAQTKATEKTNEAIAFLKKSGIAEKDIKTTGYNVYPRYEYGKVISEIYPPYPGGERRLAGYEVSQSIEVKIRTIDDAGDILSGIGEIGVENISGLTFMNDKEDDLRKEARALAIKDARKEAEGLARALGVSLARIVNFSESGNYPGPIFYKALSADSGRGGAESAPSPEITPGENKIVSNVSITYEIR